MNSAGLSEGERVNSSFFYAQWYNIKSVNQLIAHLFNDSIMVTQVRTGNPIPRIRRRIRRSSWRVCSEVGEDLYVGEGCGLGVNNLDLLAAVVAI